MPAGVGAIPFAERHLVADAGPRCLHGRPDIAAVRSEETRPFERTIGAIGRLVDGRYPEHRVRTSWSGAVEAPAVPLEGLPRPRPIASPEKESRRPAV